jgi:hypothetical protein
MIHVRDVSFGYDVAWRPAASSHLTANRDVEDDAGRDPQPALALQTASRSAGCDCSEDCRVSLSHIRPSRGRVGGLKPGRG